MNSPNLITTPQTEKIVPGFLQLKRDGKIICEREGALLIITPQPKNKGAYSWTIESHFYAEGITLIRGSIKEEATWFEVEFGELGAVPNQILFIYTGKAFILSSDMSSAKLQGVGTLLGALPPAPPR
jgi:hypothetical protein